MSRYASLEAAQAAPDGPVVNTAQLALRCAGCNRSFAVSVIVLIAPCEWAQCGSREGTDDVHNCPTCNERAFIRRAGARCHP